MDAPAAALNFLSRCRASDGGFGACPDHRLEDNVITRLTVTVTACQALQCVHPHTEEFLRRHMTCAFSTPRERCEAGPYLCSAILEWPVGMASLNLTLKAGQLALLDAESVYGQALLLRSLLHLRVPRAWKAAARLRDLQLQAGYWHGDSLTSETNVRPETALTSQPSRPMILASAISALAMAEAQPGLYFGSDLPLPKRW
jgi:hypothetical protein